MTVSLSPKSRQLVKRIEWLAKFAQQLEEDFPYREDAKQAVRDIRWILKHVKCKAEKPGLED